MESVCGGNSTAGSNPALSAIDNSRETPGAHPGARVLRIVALRIVSGPEGSSTKEVPTSAAGHLGSMVGSHNVGAQSIAYVVSQYSLLISHRDDSHSPGHIDREI